MTVIDADRGSRWFRRHRRAGAARARLVCFPHAGGTATLFHHWPGRIPGDVELLAVQYPGRQERFAEPCIEDMTEPADRITGALEPVLAGPRPLPLVLFGHSLGSAVAYEVARRLDERHGIVADRVIVSGRGAPHLERGGKLHLLDDDRLIASARRLGDLASQHAQHRKYRLHRGEQEDDDQRQPDRHGGQLGLEPVHSDPLGAGRPRDAGWEQSAAHCLKETRPGGPGTLQLGGLFRERQCPPERWS
ncbi:thioesterase II family protein [Streptomyces sp. Wb2n-11]|uniref:thioesterase II family protein n=1 Tax=Streptomyces sp. Wb2n-11 TaxID=1030533 RepID=UPI000A706459|nr:thioesterase domain-containing protein [Streptomyces sp. Wb2n-11]